MSGVKFFFLFSSYCSGQPCHLTDPGSGVRSWAQVTVCMDFGMFTCVCAGFSGFFLPPKACMQLGYLQQNDHKWGKVPSIVYSSSINISISIFSMTLTRKKTVCEDEMIYCTESGTLLLLKNVQFTSPFSIHIVCVCLFSPHHVH